MGNSGYKVGFMRKVVVGGITGYERKRIRSLDKDKPGWVPLHESARRSSGRRSRKKILDTYNWFKPKTRSEEENLDILQLEKEGRSLMKKMEMEDAQKQSGQNENKSRKPGSLPTPCSPHQERAEMGGSTLLNMGSTSNKENMDKSQEELKEANRRKIASKPNRGDPPTIATMFVDNTVNGELARRLQAAEDRLSRMTGYRIKMIETCGSQLCTLLPYTNPWSGSDCNRRDCYTCGQGGDKLEDCKKRNILYESSCSGCRVPKTDGGSRKLEKGAIYVGESARSIYERAGEHQRDAMKESDDSHMVKHWSSCHAQDSVEERPKFKIKVIATFKDALTRQVAEAVRIQMRGEGVLNSRAEYSRCSLPRLVVEKPDWVVLKELKEREEKETREAAEKITQKDEEDIMTKENGAVHDIVRRNMKKKRKKCYLETDAEKSDVTQQPGKKRRKLEKLDGWGEKYQEVGINIDIDGWLHGCEEEHRHGPGPGDDKLLSTALISMKKRNLEAGSGEPEEIPKVQKRITKKQNRAEVAKTCRRIDDMICIKKVVELKLEDGLEDMDVNDGHGEEIDMDISDSRPEDNQAETLEKRSSLPSAVVLVIDEVVDEALCRGRSSEIWNLLTMECEELRKRILNLLEKENIDKSKETEERLYLELKRKKQLAKQKKAKFAWERKRMARGFLLELVDGVVEKSESQEELELAEMVNYEEVLETMRRLWLGEESQDSAELMDVDKDTCTESEAKLKNIVDFGNESMEMVQCENDHVPEMTNYSVIEKYYKSQLLITNLVGVSAGAGNGYQVTRKRLWSSRSGHCLDVLAC